MFMMKTNPWLYLEESYKANKYEATCRIIKNDKNKMIKNSFSVLTEYKKAKVHGQMFLNWDSKIVGRTRHLMSDVSR